MLAVLVGQTPLGQSKTPGCVNGWFDFSLQHTFADIATDFVKVGSYGPIFSSNHSSTHFLRQHLDV